MIRSLFLFSLLALISVGSTAGISLQIVQKDLNSRVLLRQDSVDASINPGSLTCLMTGYTAASLLGDFPAQQQREIINEIFLTFTRKQYEDLLEILHIDNQSFIAKMNDNAKKLGLKHTYFTSAFANNDVAHRSTLEDLVILSESVLQEISYIRDTSTELKNAILRSSIARRNFDPQQLKTPVVIGGNFNDQWSGIFISENTYSSNRTRKLLTIVYNTTNLESLTANASEIIKEGLTAYETFPIFSAGATVGEIEVINGSIQRLPVFVRDELLLTIKRNDLKKDRLEAFKIQISHSSPLKAPIAEGEEVGTLTVLLQENILLSTPVYARTAVSTGNFWSRFTDTVRIALDSQNIKDKK